MPRLNHKKARTGCQRCKARKVKCDEGKPRCTACARHGVSCEYVHPGPRNTRPEQLYQTPPSDVPYNVYGPGKDSKEPTLDPLLELRLIHEWTAHTCNTISITWEFWKYQAPLIAFEFRHVLDSMLAMAALHASRQPPMQWIPLDGRMVPIRDPMYNPAHPERDISEPWKSAERWKVPGTDVDEIVKTKLNNAGNNAFLAAKRSHEMLSISRMYFDRAIDGHRRALSNLSIENIEAVYVTSILVADYALFVCSESDEDSTLPSPDPVQWLRVSRGTRFICGQWAQLVGPSWIASSGVFYGKPDMTDDDTLFDATQIKPFEKLLTYAEDYETLSPEDKEVYRKAICYIGLAYKSIMDGSDEPMATCRRLMALPSRSEPRFIDLLEMKQPRAMAILAHTFACMKLVENEVEWFKGIAERQVPKIYNDLPVGWQPMMAWPMAIINGEVTREPTETQIDDIVAL